MCRSRKKYNAGRATVRGQRAEANRKVRRMRKRMLDDFPAHKGYQKCFESWDIADYGWYEGLTKGSFTRRPGRLFPPHATTWGWEEQNLHK